MIERHGAAAYCLCQIMRAIEGAIADPKIGDAPRDKRARRTLAGFPRPEHKHCALAETAENPLGQFYCDRADRDSAARNFRVRTHLLCHSKRPLKQTVQIRTDCARRSGGFICFLCLAKYLTLADDHGIEPGGDPKEMLHTF